MLILTSGQQSRITHPEIYLAGFIQNYGLRPRFICPKDASLAKALRALGCEVMIVPDINRWHSLRVRFQARDITAQILHSIEPSHIYLVHSARTSTTPFAVKIAQHLGKRSISHLHGLAPNPDKFQRYWVDRADMVIGVSNAVLDGFLPTPAQKKCQLSTMDSI